MVPVTDYNIMLQ